MTYRIRQPHRTTLNSFTKLDKKTDIYDYKRGHSARCPLLKFEKSGKQQVAIRKGNEKFPVIFFQSYVISIS
jgi:hypothetical protein